MSTLEPIARSELFRGVGPNVLSDIVPLCQEVQYPRGAVIFEEGTPANQVAVLVHGLVTLRIDTPLSSEKVMVTAIRDAGEVFGWSALIEPYTYTSSAVCLEPSVVILIDGPGLRRLLAERPEAGFIVMRNVAAIVASRLHKARTALISARTTGLISHG